jgi:hypothetical protein
VSEIIVRIPTSHARMVAQAMEDAAVFYPRGSDKARTLRKTARGIRATLKAWGLPS